MRVFADVRLYVHMCEVGGEVVALVMAINKVKLLIGIQKIFVTKEEVNGAGTLFHWQHNIFQAISSQLNHSIALIRIAPCVGLSYPR